MSHPFEPVYGILNGGEFFLGLFCWFWCIILFYKGTSSGGVSFVVKGFWAYSLLETRMPVLAIFPSNIGLPKKLTPLSVSFKKLSWPIEIVAVFLHSHPFLVLLLPG